MFTNTCGPRCIPVSFCSVKFVGVDCLGRLGCLRQEACGAVLCSSVIFHNVSNGTYRRLGVVHTTVPTELLVGVRVLDNGRLMCVLFVSESFSGLFVLG